MLGKAIQSVVDQTFEDWELIIVDDGSTDNTWELVSSYKDQRVKYVYQKNAERSAARNKGIENANGVYVCFLDSDDYFLPERLTNLYNFIYSSNCKIAAFVTNVLIERESLNEHRVIPAEKDLVDYLVRTVIYCQQVCAHSKILKKYKFDPQFRIGEDTELWLRINSEFSFIFFSNDYSVVIYDHPDRSVNLKKSNSAHEQIKMLKFIFTKPHPGSKISKNTQNEVLSQCHFNIAKHYLYNQKRVKAILQIIISIYFAPFSPATKHKLFCLYSLLTRGKVQEYSI